GGLVVVQLDVEAVRVDPAAGVAYHGGVEVILHAGRDAVGGGRGGDSVRPRGRCHRPGDTHRGGHADRDGGRAARQPSQFRPGHLFTSPFRFLDLRRRVVDLVERLVIRGDAGLVCRVPGGDDV